MVSCTLLWILFVIISYLLRYIYTCSLFSKNIIILKKFIYSLVIMWYSGLSTKQSRYNINIFYVEHLSECEYTQWMIVRHEVGRDVMDYVDAGQVRPPGGVLIPIRFRTLSSFPCLVWFTTVYGILSVFVMPYSTLICRFIQCNIDCQKQPHTSLILDYNKIT